MARTKNGKSNAINTCQEYLEYRAAYKGLGERWPEGAILPLELLPRGQDHRLTQPFSFTLLPPLHRQLLCYYNAENNKSLSSDPGLTPGLSPPTPPAIAGFPVVSEPTIGRYAVLPSSLMSNNGGNINYPPSTSLGNVLPRSDGRNTSDLTATR